MANGYSIYGPFSAADNTILVGTETALAGQWQNTNYADLLNLGPDMQVEAEITERYQNVKDGPYKYRGGVFIKRVALPSRVPVPPGTLVAINGTDIYFVTLQKQP